MSLRVGRVAGVPIGVQPLWLVIVGMLSYVLGHDYFPVEDPGLGEVAAYALGVASALALFGGVLLHELGHAVVARRRGVAVDGIDLWLLGGVARLRGEPDSPGDELRYAAAGPAVTAVLLAVAVTARVTAGAALPEWGRAALDYQVYVSAMILGFNLLPAFPLDGGRLLRALLWRRSGDRVAATDRAATVGRAFGIWLALLGVLTVAGGGAAGLWLALIGGFLILAGRSEAEHMHHERALAGATAGRLMSRPAVSLPAEATIEQAVTDGFAGHLFGGFPLVDERGRAVGVLTLENVRAVAPADRGWVAACDVASPDPGLLVGPDLPASELLLRPAFLSAGRAVVVDAAGHPVGVVSMTDIQRRLRADTLRGPGRPTRVGAA